MISIAIVLYPTISKTHVNGTSMAPTLDDGQSIYLQTKYFEPEYGDIVVAEPTDVGQVVKRIVALPGEKVEFKDGKMLVEGVSVEEFYTPDELANMSIPEDETSFTLEDNEFYLIGDNIDGSDDSRTFGAVTKDQIKGQVIFH